MPQVLGNPAQPIFGRIVAQGSSQNLPERALALNRIEERQARISERPERDTAGLPTCAPAAFAEHAGLYKRTLRRVVCWNLSANKDVMLCNVAVRFAIA